MHRLGRLVPHSRCPSTGSRTSGDINAGASSWLANLETVILQDPLRPLYSRDAGPIPMLEVGRVKAPAGRFLHLNRAHFGAWCVVTIIDRTQRLTRS